MKEEECEQAIVPQVAQRLQPCGDAQLGFAIFGIPALGQTYSSYLSFRTTTSVEYDVEMWFDQEFGQTWQR